jgi:hypothetical protein
LCKEKVTRDQSNEISNLETCDQDYNLNKQA